MAIPSQLECTDDLTLKERDAALATIRDGRIATIYHRGRVVRLLTEADVHRCYPSLRRVRSQGR